MELCGSISRLVSGGAANSYDRCLKTGMEVSNSRESDVSSDV